MSQNVWQQPLLYLLALVAAFWPVWRWYWLRSLDGSDESWGWLPILLTALLVGWQARSNLRVAPIDGRDLWLPLGWLLIYAGGFHSLPPLARALFAVLTIACLLSRFFYQRWLEFSLSGLLILALPLLASLQFYLGYPLRAMIAKVVAPLLRFNGLAVTSAGAYLQWNEQLIFIDAPCSGVKMLWVSYLLCFTLACWWRLSNRQTLIAVAYTGLLVLAGNAFRALGLFYLEAGIIRMPSWSHTGLGLLSFGLTALAIVAAMQSLTQARWRMTNGGAS